MEPDWRLSLRGPVDLWVQPLPMRHAFLYVVMGLGLISTALAAEPSFTVLLSPGVVPCTVHVNGLTALPGDVDSTQYQFEWDFGVPAARFDTLRGFNAAHCYDTPGTYLVTLKLTDPNGQAHSMSATLVMSKNTRRVVFVSPDGSDTNAGTGPDLAFRTLGRAFKNLADDTQVMIRAGSDYAVTDTLPARRHNLVVTRYGDGDDPVLNKASRGPVLATESSSDGVIIEHLKFITPHTVGPDGSAPKVGCDAIMARGRNITVRNCTFNDIDMAVNANGKPTGLLVQDCVAPNVLSLRSYLVWGEGTDLVYLGNHMANSTREHCFRCFGTSRVLVAYNTLANVNRQDIDHDDFSKGCIELQAGDHEWVANNNVTDGDIRTGPLGQHEPDTSATEDCVIENNVVNESEISINAGSHHIRVRNNILHADNRPAIIVHEPDKAGRQIEDITIDANTAVNHDRKGNFLNVLGKTTGVVLTRNLYIAPRLHPGGYGTAFVAVKAADLSGFTTIADNVWPTLGDGAAFTVNKVDIPFSQWLATPPVTNDRCENVTWADPTSQPSR